jgi:hypothetical protein
MNRLSEIITEKFPNIETIDGSELYNPTGYIQPFLHPNTIVKFYNHGRLGYVFQIIIIDINGNLKKSCFIIHERYTGSPSPVIYNGPKEFYLDNNIRSDEFEKFIVRLQLLLNNETVGKWDEQQNDLEFVLETNETLGDLFITPDY